MVQFLSSKKIISCVLLAGFLAANYIAQTSESGQSGSYTNAPSESNCTSCHSGTSLQTSGTNWNEITLDNGFANSQYIPDSTYSMTLTYTEPGKSKFGFALTALDSATGKPIAGTFTITNTATTQKSTYTINGKVRTSVFHKSSGTTGSNGVIKWSFKWKAPSTNVGTIFFYVVINSTNNNNNDNGDVIYSKKFLYTPAGILHTPNLEVDKQLNIWPNPFNSSVNLSWGSESRPSVLEIIDIHGNKILSVSQPNIYNISATTLATENLTSGIYWLRIITQNGETLKRIIKL